MRKVRVRCAAMLALPIGAGRRLMYAAQPRPGAPLGGVSAPDPRREEQVEAAMSSRIEAGLTIEGSVRGDGELVVAGRLRGALTLHGTLVVEEGGSVEAEVEADRVVVSGLLSGSVQAHEELRICRAVLSTRG